MPEIYVKAFLKEYVRFVGLDEKVIFKKYEAYKIGKEYVEPAPETLLDKIKELKENRFEKEKETQFSKPASYQPSHAPQSVNTFNVSFLMDKRNVLFISAVVGILAVFFLIYILFIHKSTDIVVEKPYDELSQ